MRIFLLRCSRCSAYWYAQHDKVCPQVRLHLRSIYVFLLVSLVLCLKKLSVPVTSLMMLGSRMQSHLQLRVQILKGAAPSVFEYMLSILPPELPGTCHRKSTPTLHRFGRTLAQGFYVDVHVGHPRRIRKLGWENPGHGPKGLSGILTKSFQWRVGKH